MSCSLNGTKLEELYRLKVKGGECIVPAIPLNSTPGLILCIRSKILFAEFTAHAAIFCTTYTYSMYLLLNQNAGGCKQFMVTVEDKKTKKCTHDSLLNLKRQHTDRSAPKTLPTDPVACMKSWTKCTQRYVI